MPASAPSLRVALADDHSLFRDGLAALLTSTGIEITASCETANDLLPRLAVDPPDIVILDIQMPPTFTDEGIKAAERIRHELPGVGILVLSMYVEPPYATAVMSIGDKAIGYLLKDRVTNVDVLVDALARIASDECVIDPQIVKALMQRPQHQSLMSRLTDRERDVLRLMAEGHSNKGIGTLLHLSVRSVEDHIASIFNKLDLPAGDPGIHRRVQAVIAWLRGRS